MPEHDLDHQLCRSALDLQRVHEHLDLDLLSSTLFVFVGIGGAASIAYDLARCGVTNFIGIDPDTVSATNIATQGYFCDQIGMPKVKAVAETITRINPAAKLLGHACRYEDLAPNTRAEILDGATLLLAMTDNHAAQKAVNQDAVAHGVPMIAAMMGDGLQQMEVTATLPGVVKRGGGCHLCQVWPREQAYKEGFKNRVDIGSHVVSASMLNAQIAYLTLGLVHHLAGSDLPIARLGARFAASPCLLTQLDPAFWAANPESYGVVPTGMDLFTTKQFPLDSPKGWICEACGTEGQA